MSWDRLTRMLGFVSLLAFLIVAFTPVTNTVSRYAGIAPQAGPAEAIVVLAAGQENDGSLFDESMQRLVHGLTLFKSGLAPLVVLSGQRLRRSSLSEAGVRAGIARQFDIPAERLILITDVRTTRDEALRAGESLRPFNARRILLVTDWMHMRRAKLLFERAGFEVLAAPWDQPSETALMAEDRFWLAYKIVQESLALAYHRIAGYI